MLKKVMNIRGKKLIKNEEMKKYKIAKVKKRRKCVIAKVKKWRKCMIWKVKKCSKYINIRKTFPSPALPAFWGRVFTILPLYLCKLYNFYSKFCSKKIGEKSCKENKRRAQNNPLLTPPPCKALLCPAL